MTSVLLWGYAIVTLLTFLVGARHATNRGDGVLLAAVVAPTWPLLWLGVLAAAWALDSSRSHAQALEWAREAGLRVREAQLPPRREAPPRPPSWPAPERYHEAGPQ